MSRALRWSRLWMMAAAAGGEGNSPAVGKVASDVGTIVKEKQKNSGIFKVVLVSPPVCKFIGAPEASRIDVLKKIWQYIKDNNLQNPANKKEIRCDEKLKVIFQGRDSVGFHSLLVHMNVARDNVVRWYCNRELRFECPLRDPPYNMGSKSQNK